MENEVKDNSYRQEPDWEMYKEEWHKRHRRGKIFGGIILVAVGALLMARHLGALLPDWLFTWKMLLIVIGLFIGVKHKFRSFGWIIVSGIGLAFLLEDFYPTMNIGHLFWPALLILAGIFMIFRPRRRWHHEHWAHEHWKKKWDYKKKEWESRWDNSTSQEDILETVSVFGSVKKNILSKDFKGGEVNCCFGGCMINLSQADINGRVVLEINQVFGGTKLIVPPHWTVQSTELVAVMGGIDDKRPMQNSALNPEKILVLKGTTVFGGIEILNY
jgi:predicted membrane protein